MASFIDLHFPIWRYFFALVAGGLLPLAFAPCGFYPLAVICPAILLALWLRGPAHQAFWSGLLFGLGFFGVGASWVFVSIHEFGNTNSLLAAIITAIFVGILALYPAVQGYLLTRFFPNNTFFKTCLAFPSSWVLLEWIRGWLLTGFPWLFLGTSQVSSPLHGFIPIVGEYGTSFLVVLSSGLLVYICRAFFSFHSSLVAPTRSNTPLKKEIYQKQFIGVIGLAIIWLSGAMLTLPHWTQSEGSPIQVSIVQGNIPQQIKWDANYLQMTLDRYYLLTESNWKSRIIVWPEAAVPVLMHYAKDYLNSIDAQAKEHHAAFITGIPIKEGFYYYNAVIALGTGQGIYYKRHLVPFGEYVPFEAYLRGLIGFFNIPMSNFSAGPDLQADLRVGNLTIAPFVCYEIAYPQLVLYSMMHTDLLLTVSNDAWFGHSFAPAQHLQIAQVRALETGRDLVFSNNTGKSAIINAQGKIQAETKTFETTVLTGDVVKMVGLTPFVWIGITPILLLLCGLLALALYLQHRYESELTKQFVHST